MKMRLYKHDCDACKFLGTQHVGGKRFDWYVCPGLHSEIVARASDKGPDYWSMSERMVRDEDNFYGEALGENPMVATARRMIATL